MGTVGPSAKGWRGGAVWAALAIALLAWPGAIVSQPSAPREANVQLSWSPGWTPTGIVVAPGETLSIRVRTVQRTEYSHHGQERQAPSLQDKIVQTAVRQAFVGRIGEGRQFLVGRRFKKVMNEGGPLSVRWNAPRELAREQSFSVTIRVEPAQRTKEGDGGNVEVNTNLGDLPVNQTDTNLFTPQDNESSPIVNETGIEATNGQGNVAEPEENGLVAADPATPKPPEAKATEDGDTNVTADDPDTSLSTAQKTLLGGAIAALLLASVAAGVAVQRWRRRRLVNRTRALLSVSPSLDLGEGACRGGGRPAGGPAASLRARIEDGAVRMAGGGQDG